MNSFESEVTETAGFLAGSRFDGITLIHRYKVSAVHYVSPTEDNRYQAQRMKAHGLFTDVHDEVGQIIVADVSAENVKALLAADRVRLDAVIQQRSV